MGSTDTGNQARPAAGRTVARVRGVVAGLALCLLTALPGRAATLVVTTTNDSGAGSLRQALTDAQPGDTITFSVTGTITLTSGELVLDKDLTIAGPGAPLLTISGNQASRVFLVNNGVTATMQDVTISNGFVADDGAGGIGNFGMLTLSHSTLAGNSALNGGGIAFDGTVHIKNSLVATSPSGGDCVDFDSAGGLTGAGVNFDTDGTCAGFTHVTAAQLNLGPLADNGGPTPTQALLPGSIALNAAPAEDGFGHCSDFDGTPAATDQRGVARPQESACDVGAFELEAGYPFSGFFPPVDNPPILNGLKAGSAVPVQFSLGGNQGLSILAVGLPTSEPVACDTTAALDTITQTVTAGGSSLSYDAATQTYTYVWKTDKGWAGTCRQLHLQLIDESQHTALFKFTK